MAALEQSAQRAAKKPWRLRKARAVLAQANKRGAPLSIPASATLDQAFIAAAIGYRKAASEYHRAIGGWQNFSAAHTHDDPGHDDHLQRVLNARRTLNAADAAFVLAVDEVTA